MGEVYARVAQFIAFATKAASSTETPGSPARARSAGMICFDGSL